MIQEDSHQVITQSERRRLRKSHMMKDYEAKFIKVLQHTRTPFGDRTQEIKNQSNPMPNILDLIPLTIIQKQQPVFIDISAELLSVQDSPQPDFIDITTLEDKENYEPFVLEGLSHDTLHKKRAEKALKIKKALSNSNTLLKKRAPFGEITKDILKNTSKKNQTYNKGFNNSSYETPEFASTAATKGRKRIKSETTCYTNKSKVSCKEGIRKVTDFLTKIKKDTDLYLKELTSSGEFPIGDFLSKKNFVRKVAAKNFEGILKEIREVKDFFN